MSATFQLERAASEIEATPITHGPRPEDFRALYAEIAGLERRLAQLESGVHSDEPSQALARIQRRMAAMSPENRAELDAAFAEARELVRGPRVDA